MKIAFVNGLFPQLSQTFVLDQIDYAVACGHQVAVVAAKKEDGVDHYKVERSGLYARLYSENLPLRERAYWVTRGALKTPRSFAQAFASQLADRSKLPVGSLALQGQIPFVPDVLLVNFGTNLPAAERLKRQAYPNARIACIFHGFDVSKYTQENGWSLYERMGPSVDLALTVNAAQARALKELGTFARVETLHLGIDLSRLPKRKPHGDRGFALLFVGRAVEKKGLTYLVEAMDQLRDLDVRLHVVGGGPLLRDEQIHARVRGLSERIVFHGPRPHEFVLDLMSSCDCLVAPSITALDGDAEGIPVALMEAMVIGTPIISTFHSGIPELVSDGVQGRLVPERDVAALVSAIREEIRAPGRFVSAARTKVETDFALGTQYGKLFGALEALLDR